MSASPSIHELRTLSDEELIRRHDSEATHTLVGTQYYLDELHRRAQERQTITVVRYTKYIFWLTVAVGVLTATNVWLVVNGP